MTEQSVSAILPSTATMSLPITKPSPPKRPRLSLQTRAPSPDPETIVKTSTALLANIDTSSPTAFNTLSNAYATAIENSSPVTAIPLKSLVYNPLKTAMPAKKTSLRLVTNAAPQPVSSKLPSQHLSTPGPFTIVYPDTPTPYSEESTPITAYAEPMILTTTPFTYTPPQSAHPDSPSVANNVTGSRAFTFPLPPTNLSINTTFSSNAPAQTIPSITTPVSTSPTLRRRHTAPNNTPYSHPRSLHSILRNSPLPPRSTITPISPSRVSARIAARAAKKLMFNNPLTQTITTQTYTKSHIDLLAEEASPFTPTDPELQALGIGAGRGPAATTPTSLNSALQSSLSPTIEVALDLSTAFLNDEILDGGQTPGGFEEMRRRMAGLDTLSARPHGTKSRNGPATGKDANSSGSDNDTPKSRKRKREKKRRWVWTIGVNDEEDSEGGLTAVGETPITAIKRGETPEHLRGVVYANEKQRTIAEIVEEENFTHDGNVGSVENTALATVAEEQEAREKSTDTEDLSPPSLSSGSDDSEDVIMGEELGTQQE